MPNPVSEDIYFHHLPRRLLLNNFCERKWVTLYRKETSVSPFNDNVEIFSHIWTYFITPSCTQAALDEFESEMRPEEFALIGLDNSNCESTVVEMSFYDIRPIKRQLRINEKFIYLFNLFEETDANGNRIYFKYKNGIPEIVITINSNEVKILHQYLNDFLTTYRLNLVCYIKSEVNMPPEIAAAIEYDTNYTGHSGITERPTPNEILNFSVAITGGQFQSWLYGKSIVPYKQFGEFKSSFDEEYADFIIAYDTSSCSEICVSCEDDSHRYSRTFFRKGVLEKYRLDPNAKVEDRLISSTYFALKCDNDNPGFIWAYLKDLRCLPYTEQLHWKGYNYLPDDDSPSQFYLESQKNWNVRSTSPDFLFRYLFTQANDLWQTKFGWYLFKPTTGLQENHLQRIFLVGEDKYGHFDSLILMLNVVLRESINKDELIKAGTKRAEGSVVMLSYFLENKGMQMTPLVNFLFKLGSLRSLTEAHRIADLEKLKDKERKHLEESMEYIDLSLDRHNYVEASFNLFVKANEAFKWLIRALATI